MLFKDVTLKSIKGDMIKSSIILTFTVDQTEENLKLCDQLRSHAPTKDETPYLDIDVFPHQLPLRLDV